MKKNLKTTEITRLKKAAFRLGSPELGGNSAYTRLESVLARVLGGTTVQAAGCTTFTCNMYAPST